MKIWHNIALSVNDQRRAAFHRAGIELQTDFANFEMSEEDPRWRGISQLAQLYELPDIAWTKFASSELRSAEYLAMLPSWHHGYPESSDDFGYLLETFDLSEYCPACGNGKRQIAPFRMKKAPSWGAKSILQLNWIFDEYFVKSEVWSKVLEPLGVASKPVVLHRTGARIDSVVQLDIPTVADLELDEAQSDTCPICNRAKYAFIRRGFSPKPKCAEAAVFKSSQWFGSGASASKLVIVSKRVYRCIADAGLKGVIFEPCEQ